MNVKTCNKCMTPVTNIDREVNIAYFGEDKSVCSYCLTNSIKMKTVARPSFPPVWKFILTILYKDVLVSIVPTLLILSFFIPGVKNIINTYLSWWPESAQDGAALGLPMLISIILSIIITIRQCNADTKFGNWFIDTMNMNGTYTKVEFSTDSRGYSKGEEKSTFHAGALVTVLIGIALFIWNLCFGAIRIIVKLISLIIIQLKYDIKKASNNLTKIGRFTNECQKIVNRYPVFSLEISRRYKRYDVEYKKLLEELSVYMNAGQVQKRIKEVLGIMPLTQSIIHNSKEYYLLAQWGSFIYCFVRLNESYKLELLSVRVYPFNEFKRKVYAPIESITLDNVRENGYWGTRAPFKKENFTEEYIKKYLLNIK